MVTSLVRVMENIGAITQSVLNHELARRCSNNSSYSLRSFAKSLGVSHSLLSMVLNNKRPPSKAFVMKVISAVSLDSKDEGVFREFLTNKSSNLISSNKKSSSESEYIKIDLKTYSIISEWHFYAILSLLDLKNSQWCSKWISSRLGITEAKSSSAMNILMSMEIVEKKRNGRWKQTNKPLKVENIVSTKITREVHRQLLNKALESLDKDSISERDFSYCTFAMNEELIPFALKEIRNFRRDLMSKLEKKGKANRVYELCVQLFPVSKGLKV